MATRKPARVLPDPGGAEIRVSWPEAMRGQPRAWGSVGPSGKRRRNQVATAGWNAPRAPWGSAAASVDRGSTARSYAPTLTRLVTTGRLHRWTYSRPQAVGYQLIGATPKMG